MTAEEIAALEAVLDVICSDRWGGINEHTPEIIRALIERERAGGEGAQIVAWLRAEGETWYGAGNQGVAEIVQDAADAIESGAHERACDEG